MAQQHPNKIPIIDLTHGYEPPKVVPLRYDPTRYVLSWSENTNPNKPSNQNNGRRVLEITRDRFGKITTMEPNAKNLNTNEVVDLIQEEPVASVPKETEPVVQESKRNFEAPPSFPLWRNPNLVYPMTMPFYPQEYVNYYPFRCYDNMYDVPSSVFSLRYHQNCCAGKFCKYRMRNSEQPIANENGKVGDIEKTQSPVDGSGRKLAPIEFISVNEFPQRHPENAPEIPKNDGQSDEWKNAFEIVTCSPERNPSEATDKQVNPDCVQSEDNEARSNFKCSICSEEFSQRSVLRKHEQRHKRSILCSCEKIQQKRRRKSRKHVFTRVKSHTKSKLINSNDTNQVINQKHRLVYQSAMVPKLAVQNCPKPKRKHPLFMAKTHYRPLAPKPPQTLEVQIENSKEGQKYIFLNGKKYLIQQIVDTASGETFSAENFNEPLENCSVQNISLQNDQRQNVFGPSFEFRGNESNQILPHEASMLPNPVAEKNVNAPTVQNEKSTNEPEGSTQKILEIKKECLQIDPKVILKQEKFDEFPMVQPSKKYKTKNGNPGFPCKTCNRSFTSLTFLTRHLKSHHFQCAICQEELPSHELLQKHIQYHNSARLVCVLCNKDFSRQSVLDSHVKTCCGNTSVQYKCDYCQEIFNSDKPLAHHMKKHENDKNYEDNKCFIVV